MTSTNHVTRTSSFPVSKAAILLFLLGTTSVFGREYAVLANGFRLHIISHVIEAERVKLKTDQGVIELPLAQVASFEQEDYTPPVIPPSPLPPPPPSPAAPPLKAPTPRELVTAASLKAGIPPALVHSLVGAESAYQVNALSPKGAIGLMQLMPGTAAALNADPHDVQQNVDAGVAYLRDLLIRYQNDPHQVTKALAAYNAGPGAVDRYNGIPPYRETVSYVSRIVRQYLNTQVKSQ